LILAFVTSKEDNAHLGYILPNILKKVLELFLMFKMPGPDGLGSKLKHEYVRDCGVGEARINALYRLVEVESHGDNLDDLVSFSSMTVEEARDAANALFALMGRLDSQHFNRMKALCV
jgi:AAA domain